MNPFHPKLRKALLADPEHRRRGLTEALLIQYEGLLNQAFHDRYYPEPDHEDCYKITAETISNVAAAKPRMPDAILSKLQDRIGELFHGGNAFLEMLKPLLGKDFDEYKDAILKYADRTQCTLADHAFTNFREKKIPDEVIKKLESLKYLRVSGKENFSSLLEEKIGKTAAEAHGSEILSAAIRRDTRKDIRNFRDTYMPNFDRIHRQWVNDQKAAINAHYFDLDVRNLLRSSLNILKNIFIAPLSKWIKKQPIDDLTRKTPRA